jgi:hypothetical protein
MQNNKIMNILPKIKTKVISMKKGIKVIITLLTFSILISSSWARREPFSCEEKLSLGRIVNGGYKGGRTIEPHNEGWILFVQSGKGRNKKWTQHGIYENQQDCEDAARGD